MIASDIHRAIAVLSLEYDIVDRATAQRLINENPGTTDVLEALLEKTSLSKILPCIAKELGIEFYDLHARNLPYRVEQDVLDRFDNEQLIEHAAIPLVDSEGNIVIAMGNPNDSIIRDYIGTQFPNVAVIMADQLQVQSELLRFGSSEKFDALAQARSIDVVTTTPTAERVAQPMLEYVEQMFTTAIASDASDVHFESQQDGGALLRYRIDGRLELQRKPPYGREKEIVGTILARANMDSSNLLEPQDGTFSFNAAGRRIDGRVSYLPQENGASLVVRLLDSANMNRRLDDMGFLPEHLHAMRNAMTQSQGTVVIVGPTGSGKTTTLYGLLKEADAEHSKVMTIEDPVEYRLPFVIQTQVRNNLGARSLTFARVLRAQLRQDPDIILVGECRDQDTARVALEAAITGHLVLTTVHAPSAVAVYTRLIEMGVPAYSVAEALNLVVSQRLLRRLHECAERRPVTPEEAEELTSMGRSVPDTAMYPVGCSGCGGTGYRGRLAAVEVLRPTLSLKRLVVERKPLEDLINDAIAHGFVDIMSDGLRHVEAGLTTIAEVFRMLDAANEAEDVPAPHERGLSDQENDAHDEDN